MVRCDWVLRRGCDAPPLVGGMVGDRLQAGTPRLRGLRPNGTFTLPGSSVVGARAGVGPSLCVLLLVFVGVYSLGVAFFGLRAVS